MMGFERYPLLKQKTLSVKVYDIVFTWLIEEQKNEI